MTMTIAEASIPVLGRCSRLLERLLDRDAHRTGLREVAAAAAVRATAPAGQTRRELMAARPDRRHYCTTSGSTADFADVEGESARGHYCSACYAEWEDLAMIDQVAWTEAEIAIHEDGLANIADAARSAAAVPPQCARAANERRSRTISRLARRHGVPATATPESPRAVLGDCARTLTALRMLADPATRAELGANGRARLTSHGSVWYTVSEYTRDTARRLVIAAHVA